MRFLLLFLASFSLFAITVSNERTETIDNINSLDSDAVSILTPLELSEETTPANPAASFYRLYPKSDGVLYILDSAGSESAVGGAVLTGNIDNRLVRTDGTSGNAIQDSGITVDDTDNVSGIANLTVTGTTTLSTGLTGFLKAASGVVSAQALIDLTTDVTGILPIANGGTGSATQNFVDLSTTQTISGTKTFDGKLVTSSTTEASKPCPLMTEVQRDALTPADGECVYNTDAKKLNTYDVAAGAWVEAGSGGEGGINYIVNSDAETGVDDWNVYADAAGTEPVDGTGGTATVTIAQNTTTPLRGDADFNLVKTAADSQGQGWSTDFTIDNQDKGKKLASCFDYDFSDANYDDGDIGVYIYDVTNSNLIRVETNEEVAGGSSTHCSVWQAAIDSTSYRLIQHVRVADATAWDLFTDRVQTGPLDVGGGSGETVVFAAGNDGSAVTGATTDINFTEVKDTKSSWSGTQFSSPESGQYLVEVGTLFTANLAQSIDIYKSGTFFRRLTRNDSQARFHGSTVLELDKDETFTIRPENSATLSNSTSEHWLQIVKLGTSDEEKAGSGGKLIAARYYSSTAQTLTSTPAVLVFDTVDEETQPLCNTATGACTIPKSSWYRITARTASGTAQGDLGIQVRVGGTTRAFNRNRESVAGNGVEVNDAIYLNKDEFLEIYNYGTGGGSTQTGEENVRLSIVEIDSASGGPDGIPTVAARYTSDAGQTAASGATYVFEDIGFDSHGAYNTATGEYTVPTSGKYAIVSSVRSSVNVTLLQLTIHVNGVAVKNQLTRVDTATTIAAVISDALDLNKDDIVEIVNDQGISHTLDTTTQNNTFSIARIK